MKKLKINLLVDGVRCKNREDIKENFNILDVLEYFKNGKLIKWAKVRGLNELVNKLESISKNKDLDIAKSLCDIFEIQTDEKELKDELNFYRVENTDIKNIAKIIPYLDKIENLAKNDIDKIQNVIPYLDKIKELGENKNNLEFLNKTQKFVKWECEILLLEISQILYIGYKQNNFEDIEFDISNYTLKIGSSEKIDEEIKKLFKDWKKDDYWNTLIRTVKCSAEEVEKLKKLKDILVKILNHQNDNSSYINTLNRALLGFKGL
jgi:hypothetical protein